MVEEQQQIVRTGSQRFVQAGHGGVVLADETSAGGHRAIHAGALFVGVVPLSPAVALGGFHGDPVMIAGDIGEGL